MPGTTTGEDRTARSSSSHPGPATPWPIFPRNGSGVGLSSAASSTNTSEPPERPGHGHRHSSGTPQVIRPQPADVTTRTLRVQPVRVIRNSPARAFADLHLFVSKVLI